MKKFELRTESVPFINVDTNETLLDPDYIFSEYDDEDGESMEDFDFNTYKKYILEQSKPYLEKFIEYLRDNYSKLSIRSGEAVEIYSPRNRYTGGDELFFDITIGISFEFFTRRFLLYVSKNRITKGGEEDFDEFLKNNYSSRPGFSSFLPNNIIDFKRKTESGNIDEDLAIGVMLRYIVEKDDVKEDFQEDFEQDVFDNKDNYYSYISENKYNNLHSFKSFNEKYKS